MTSDAHRWQAAMGAIAGLVAADAAAQGGDRWGEVGERAITIAEDHLAGALLPIDLGAVEAVPVAVGLAGGASPLLVDGRAVAVLDHVRRFLEDGVVDGLDPTLAGPAEMAVAASGFVDLVGDGAIDDEGLLAAALYGLHHGIGAIPARLVSSLTAPDERRGRRYLTRLADRLLGIRRNDWYDPRSRRGPREVLPGVWLSNIHGINSFVNAHPDGLVLSLCDIEGRLDGHDQQITFHLDDTPKPDANPTLSRVVDEVLAEVRGARAAGQPVLVHCRHGASRTGLILRLLLIEDLDIDADAALTEAQCLWPHTSTWNTAWAREIERRCAVRS